MSNEQRQQIVPQEEGPCKNVLMWLIHKKWYPNPNVYTTIGMLTVFSLTFMTIAFWMYIQHKNVVEVVVGPYEDDINCIGVLQKSGQYCELPVRINKHMQKPVYVLYQLDNFYQNHRRYVDSKNNDQLEGKIITYNKAKDKCSPVILNKHLNTRYAWDGKTLLDPQAVANPCGLIAKTFFNDTFELFLNGQNIPINSTGIARLNDRLGKYKRAPDSSRIQWIDPEDEHFQVWMRTASLPNSRKLYGKIEQDLPPGTYTLRLHNNYNAKRINADKNFVLTTANIFGGSNLSMTIGFLAASLFCIAACLVFFYKLWATNWTFGVSQQDD